MKILEMGAKGSKVKDKDLKDETNKNNEKSNDKEKSSKEEKKEEPKVPFLKLFRFATGLDIFLIIIGLLAAVGVGISQPLMFIARGHICILLGFTTLSYHSHIK